MESKNMNYAFGVEYLEEALKGSVDNKDLVSVINSNIGTITKQEWNKVQELEKAGATVTFFEIQYPGMLMGTGYPHETGAATGEIQVGFSFDYVTGAPEYPGSSLKGVIKHANSLTNAQIPEKDIDNDVFYGAYVVGVKNFAGEIMGLDNLAPHGDDITKAPNIITMLRLMPGVIIAVAMKTEESRKDKYIEFLELMGIGAKTNVGYGQLIKVDFDYKELENRVVKEVRSEKKAPEVKNEKSGQGKNNAYVVGQIYEGTVTGYNDKKITAYITLNNGGRASLYFKEVKGAEYGKIDSILTLALAVKVKYKGKNEQGYDSFSLVQ